MTRPLSASGKRRPHGCRRGFTLIEMVGVLALMTLCAGIVAPNFARRLSRTKGAAEATRLEAIREALLHHAEVHQEIPGAASWAASVAMMTGLTETDVRQVLPQDPSTARIFLVHPSFTPAAGGGSAAGNAVWRQGVDGTPGVSNARLMIISVHRPGLTLPLPNGYARSVAEFENVWNWTPNPATGAPPPGWSAEWMGNGEYLHVCRLNFAPLFHCVTFSNTSQTPGVGYVQIGGAAAVPIAEGSTSDRLYLGGTNIRLMGLASGGSSAPALQLSHTLRAAVNFVYADNRWQIL